MIKNLVIVESPAKAKTIENFLGKDYIVKSSFGHVRDLSKYDFGVDVENDFSPKYEIPTDKKKIVDELKKLSSEATSVWLASDEDREGEAISWHLAQALELDEKNTKRIVFHEITKTAILHAIENPRIINKNLVDAQQARRVLDRLVGYEISPVLWKKVKPALSAGRVQSVAVRLIVEREKEIQEFKTESSFRVTAEFILDDDGNKKAILKAELPKRFSKKEEAISFLESCKNSDFTISKIEKNPAKKSPAPPFITSTLQQEASRKLSFSVAKTMLIAQQLYESGNITYMRTDSVNLSNSAIAATKEEITKQYGEKYVKTRKYTTKAKGAQEAHEAIRPTYLGIQQIESTRDQKRLYELIWKRTIASQMSDAELEKTSVSIDVSNSDEHFVAKGEVIKFDGFLKVYFESTDEDDEENVKGMLPPMVNGQKLTLSEMIAVERFSQHSPRYTEASLVKKLEVLGIGRPSTYAPIISTIQKRGYVTNESRTGKDRNYSFISLSNQEINDQIKTENTGSEKAKLFPSDIGMVVNNFLVEYFDDILDYHFTANVEKEFDEIANGAKIWNKMIKDFYSGFHKKVQDTLENSPRVSGERLLGTDPKTGRNIYSKIGKFGPMVQIGDAEETEKPKFAGLLKDQQIDTITLEQALDLFELPKAIGDFEGETIMVAIGKFGPYLKHNSANYAIPKDENPLSVIKDRAVEIIEEKRIKDKEKIIQVFEDNKNLSVLKGRWGAYISFEKKNYKIPKDKDPKELTIEECLEIIEQAPVKNKKKK